MPHDSNSKIYKTPCYSIENYVTSTETFEEILKNDFLLIAEEQPLRAKLHQLFLEQLDDFNKKMLPINAYMKWLRSVKAQNTNFPDDISPFININSFTLTAKFEPNTISICNALNASAMPFESEFHSELASFAQQDLAKWGRGKFVFDFFKKFITALYQDRRSENPMQFSQKKMRGGDPTHNFLPKLANYSNPPECLKSFLENWHLVTQ